MNPVMIKLISKYEGLHDGDLKEIGLQPKMDPVGIWTEGWGHAIIDSKGNFVKGIDCKTNAFYIESYLDNLICEYCIGGNYSFGYDGTISGTFNNCIGGEYSFGSYSGIISGTFNDCVGGKNSFGTYGGTIQASARLYYTRITSGTFPTPMTGGRLILCIDGNNSIVTI